MIDWRRSLGKEARSLVALMPLLVVSALFGFGTSKSQAVERVSQSPVSPVSPLGSPTPANTAISSGFQDNLWIIAIVVLAVIFAVAAFWVMRRPRGA